MQRTYVVGQPFFNRESTQNGVQRCCTVQWSSTSLTKNIPVHLPQECLGRSLIWFGMMREVKAMLSRAMIELSW